MNDRIQRIAGRSIVLILFSIGLLGSCSHDRHHSFQVGYKIKFLPPHNELDSFRQRMAGERVGISSTSNFHSLEEDIKTIENSQRNTVEQMEIYRKNQEDFANQQASLKEKEEQLKNRAKEARHAMEKLQREEKETREKLDKLLSREKSEKEAMEFYYRNKVGNYQSTMKKVHDSMSQHLQEQEEHMKSYRKTNGR